MKLNRVRNRLFSVERTKCENREVNRPANPAESLQAGFAAITFLIALPLPKIKRLPVGPQALRTCFSFLLQGKNTT